VSIRFRSPLIKRDSGKFGIAGLRRPEIIPSRWTSRYDTTMDIRIHHVAPASVGPIPRHRDRHRRVTRQAAKVPISAPFHHDQSQVFARDAFAAGCRKTVSLRRAVLGIVENSRRRFKGGWVIDMDPAGMQYRIHPVGSFPGSAGTQRALLCEKPINYGNLFTGKSATVFRHLPLAVTLNLPSVEN
jgi:hypothetical protein